MIWLGDKRGNLSDWVTQQWVRATGRRISLKDHAWLDGPSGGTRKIGKSFFETYAIEKKLEIVRDRVRGLIPDFSSLQEGNTRLAAVASEVKSFYEQTSEFDLDAWSEWHGMFRPFGKALSLVFSSRLQQLNVPLSSLDSSKGMTSSVVQMMDPVSKTVVLTAWVRELRATNNVLYAGGYSICKVPGHPSPCVKVVFPLPNGNAIVLLKAEARGDGSLSIKSRGDRFGDPGFYFVVHDAAGMAWARYVRSMKEEIHVYAAEGESVRTDHTLWLWGVTFLRLHYRMRRRHGG
ncbi:MAG: hypothetical protein WBE76_27610 [Terracidiphilus sp.]